jgi:hypothetical protein
MARILRFAPVQAIIGRLARPMLTGFSDVALKV